MPYPRVLDVATKWKEVAHDMLSCAGVCGQPSHSLEMF